MEVGACRDECSRCFEGTPHTRAELWWIGLEIGVVEWEHSTAKWVHLPFRPSDRGSRGLCVELVMPAFHITAQTQHRTLLGSAVPGGAWRSARPSATSRLLEVVAPRSGLLVRRHAHRNIAGDAGINTHCRIRTRARPIGVTLCYWCIVCPRARTATFSGISDRW